MFASSTVGLRWPVPRAIVAFLAAGVLASGYARTDDSGAERLKEMTELARAVKVQEAGPSGEKAADLVPEPMNRYDDQPRQIEDGTLWAFGKPGRPTAALKVEMYPGGLALYGLVSLSPRVISAAGGDGWSWTARKPGLEMKPMPGAPAPAATERERLVQMKGLARRFSGHEYDGPARGRIELRLLPRPVARYADSASGLVDGAIFALAFGTNPETLLLLEARTAPGSSSPTWQYGLAHLGGSEVSVAIDNREVWTEIRALPVPATRDAYMNRHIQRAARPR